jgi:hypothetical protein
MVSSRKRLYDKEKDPCLGVFALILCIAWGWDWFTST